MVSLIDLPPTILTAAGVAPPSHMRGRPVQELVAGDAADWPQEVFIQISESQCGRAIRTQKWKYSVRAPDKGGQDPASDVYVEDFLYDLERDPHERDNLVVVPGLRDVREVLAATLRRRMVQAGEREPTILPQGSMA
jgi:arylsulfatase A-like enzyme